VKNNAKTNIVCMFAKRRIFLTHSMERHSIVSIKPKEQKNNSVHLFSVSFSCKIDNQVLQLMSRLQEKNIILQQQDVRKKPLPMLKKMALSKLFEHNYQSQVNTVLHEISFNRDGGMSTAFNTKPPIPPTASIPPK
jgi:hypothetical protein